MPMPMLLKKPRAAAPLPLPHLTVFSGWRHVSVSFSPRGSRLLELDAEKILNFTFGVRPGAYGQNVSDRLVEEMGEFLESWLVNLVVSGQLWWHSQLQVWQYLL